MRVDGTRYYILKDNLGSASVTTNQSATTVGEDRFYPFGETRFTTGSMQTDKLFTGQRQITGLGIYHYGARFYSPKLGRFLSADTIMSGAGNPQNLNRFSYVNNNPLRYTDPTGHRACDDFDSTGKCVTAPGGGGSGFGGVPKPKKKPGKDLGLEFRGNGTSEDMQAFADAAKQEANRLYNVLCSRNPHFAGECGYASPADLYVATHGTTVITFSNSTQNYYCERNANVGEQGVICYANSRGYIDLALAAHEMGHVFNALIANNSETTPYTDLANERSSNDNFPDIRIDITDGYINNRRLTDGEDFANMYSMWVFNDWPDTPGGEERRRFMNDNMFTWILRLLP